jgi:hypothetical protein
MSAFDGTQPPSDEDTTSEEEQTQAPKLAVVSSKHTYDSAMVQKFIDLVFHVRPINSEVALYGPPAGKLPGYPSDNLNDFNRLLSGTKPRAMYFGTSSITRDVKGELRNKLVNFSGLHVVVLDDIGTKIDAADIPDGLATPTYVIETSAGNFQWGYVLEKPLEDKDEAQALMTLLKHHEPRVTDKGGVNICKIVRLPEGVNGKKGPKGRFNVKLINSNGPYYPADVLRKHLLPGQVVPAKKTGRILPYKPLFDMPDFGLPADEVMMFLYRQEMVLADAPEQNEWATIECPWAHDHSDSATTAGYSPLGYGEGKNAYSRGFKCFHDHCSARTTEDFLNWIVVHDSAIKLVARELPPEAVIPMEKYAISTEKSGIAFNLAATISLEVQIGGMKQKYYTDVWAHDGGKKMKRLNAADYWAVNPLTTRADGLGYEVTEDRLLESTGRRLINQYAPPPWTDGNYDQAAVDKFLNYVNYLLPEPEEAEYFLDWLAAKLQNPRFRGSAILMVTDGTQGVGRTTLSKYVTDFLGLWNTSSIQFDEMVNANFNEWVMSLLVIVNEVQDSDAKSYRKQEILKHYVDTSPIEIQVNVKHGFKGPAEICSSFLMFSNHTDALKTAVDDRRFTILRNPDVVDKSLTAEMHLWRLNEAATPYNAEDLYRYFRQRVITSKLFEPLNTTAAEDMKTETKGVTEMVADAVAKACAQQDLIAVPATSLASMYAQTFAGARLTAPEDPRMVYKRVSKLFFRPALGTATVRVGDEIHKPRLVKRVALGVAGVAKIRKNATVKMKSLPLSLQTRIITDLQRFDEEATVAIAVALLSD